MAALESSDDRVHLIAKMKHQSNRGDRRIANVLWNDPATGFMRHADAGYEDALDCAREKRIEFASNSLGANHVMKITDKQVEDFNRDGAVLLKGAFADYVEQVQQAIEENKANPSWRERTYHSDDGSAPFFQDYCVWSQFDGYKALVSKSPMAAIAARLMESKTARIFHDHILVKEPGNSVVTPWHQDQPYYLVEAKQSVSFWVPLDPVPRDRTIEYVAGSHKWNKDFKPTRFDGTALFENDDSEQVPDVEAKRNELDILGWAVEPGDAVAFSFSTLHGAPANASPTRRRVISVRWVGDDAKFADRPGKTSPAFPDLNFTPGAPFEADEFPVLFTA